MPVAVPVSVLAILMASMPSFCSAGSIPRLITITISMLASDLKDLLAPAGNRLEKLKGDRAGQYGIRINEQWRICFVWMEDGPHDVEITDYH